MEGLFAFIKKTLKHGAFAVNETFDIEIKKVEDKRDSLTVAQALKTVFRQMQISGNRPRIIESYEFAWNEFIKVTGVKYVEDIDADMIYDYLLAGDKKIFVLLVMMTKVYTASVELL